jgi:hypothetical protein
MSDYPIHPAAEIMPDMTPDEFQQLTEDIRANGLIESIVLYDDMILDGRHRDKACKVLGLVAPYITLDQELHPDPVAYVLSTNLHRRHLTTGQRAFVAANTASYGHGGSRHGDQEANLPLENTTAEAASLLNVSPRSVTTARSIRSSGNQDVIDAVRNGEMTLHKASQEIKERAGDRVPERPAKDSKWHVRKAKNLLEAARRSADDYRDLAQPSDYESLDKGMSHVWNILDRWGKA